MYISKSITLIFSEVFPAYVATTDSEDVGSSTSVSAEHLRRARHNDVSSERATKLRCNDAYRDFAIVRVTRWKLCNFVVEFSTRDKQAARRATYFASESQSSQRSPTIKLPESNRTLGYSVADLASSIKL